MTPPVARYVYGREAFFRDDFPFAIRRVRNRAEDFNLAKRFRRMFWKITYVISGEGDYVIGGSRFPFRRNSLIVVHPGAETTYDISGEALELCNIVFDRTFLPETSAGLRDPFHFLDIFSADYRREYESPLYLLTATREIAALIRSLHHEFEEHAPNRETMLRLRFAELVLLILRRAERRGHRNPEWTAHYVRERIRHDFAGEFSQRALAGELRITPERLSRLYRERFGSGIMADLKRIRLEHAAELLRAGGLAATEAGRRSGFRDPSYFFRAFAAHFGCSPEQYRKGRI